MDYNVLLKLHDLLAQREDPDSDIEWQDVADFLTEATGTVYRREFCRKSYPFYSLYDKAGWIRPPDDVPGSETANTVSGRSTTINQDGSQLSELRTAASYDDLCDPEYLLRLHGYDPRCFELTSAKASQWGSDEYPLYSSKITVKPKVLEPTDEDIGAWFDRLDRHYQPPVLPKAAGWGEGDKLLVVPISDLHFNMQATMFNSGNEYNCEIAEKLFFYIIQDVLEQTAQYHFKQILFTIGGDQLDADSPANATTRGTPQCCDKHYFDACEQMYAMTVKAVDILAGVAPVHVIHVAGNHDKVTSYKLARFVDAWFRNDGRVTVDYAPLPRHYYRFGKTLFVFAHDGDVKRLQKLIPDEARELWAQVNQTEVFLQHLHSETVLAEDCGMRIQRLPSPVARSVWTNDQGYRSARQCKSFVYDENLGLRNVIYTVAPE